MRTAWSAHVLVAYIGLFVVSGTGRAEGLPYAEPDTSAHAMRKYHVGGAIVGIRHLGGTGIGVVGNYGNWQRAPSWIGWGGEVLLLHSGERRVAPTEAHNSHFAADTASVAIVYEEVGMVGLAGAAYAIIRTTPDYGLHLPGVVVGLSVGFMVETDRVGLRSSEVEAYYGYGTSDTDISLRPYLRPQLVVSQGPVSVAAAIACLPEFPSWSVGVSYGW